MAGMGGQGNGEGEAFVPKGAEVKADDHENQGAPWTQGAALEAFAPKAEAAITTASTDSNKVFENLFGAGITEKWNAGVTSTGDSLLKADKFGIFSPEVRALLNMMDKEPDLVASLLKKGAQTQA